MKKILYFLSFVFVALFTACSEGDDFDIDYTPIAPVGGEYRINVERGYDASKTAYAINAKVSIDMSAYTFGGENVDDFIGNSATATDKVTVSGKCGHNTYTTVSGTVTDEISFTYSRSDQPGYHYRVTGFKSTGWAEDNK